MVSASRLTFCSADNLTNDRTAVVPNEAASQHAKYSSLLMAPTARHDNTPPPAERVATTAVAAASASSALQGSRMTDRVGAGAMQQVTERAMPVISTPAFRRAIAEAFKAALNTAPSSTITCLWGAEMENKAR